MAMEDMDINKSVYDHVYRNFTETDIKDKTKYDEIIASITEAFGEQMMMQYINSGFTRPA